MKRLFTILTLAAASATTASQAQSSAIAQVLLYPGGAQVERTLRVPAGAAEARFACLPPQLNPDMLQIQAPAGVNLGELKVETVARDTLPECRRRDPRVLELEKQMAAVDAEISGVDIALGYLKGMTDRDAKAGAGLAASLETMRRNGQELSARLAALRERQAELAAQRRGALAGQPKDDGDVSVVRVRLSAAGATDLALTYRLANTGWMPQYRARLDTATGALSVERLAQIAQNSGEDWVDVKLRLSTVQPRQAVAGRSVAPWTLRIQPPVQASPAPPMAALYAPVAPAPAMARERIEVTGSRVNFDASVFQGEFGTEYDLPQRVTLLSNGERSTVSLGRESMDAKLFARVQPKVEAAAYLVAEVPRPQGSWPSGPVQLFRDGSLIGQTPLQFGDSAIWTVPFGRDERLRVRVEPEKREGADAGLIAARRELTLTRQWQVENLRTRPVTLQVLEAAPVAQHEDIRVQTQFTPAVSAADWRDQPGVQMWELPLAASQTQRFQAVYRISVPKDAPVIGLP